MRPSARVSGRVSVTPTSGWGSGTRSPARYGSSHRTSSFPARAARSASSCGAVSVPSRRRAVVATIGPVSSPASMRMSVTPVLVIARDDRRRDRRRAAMPWQQRRMQVQRPVRQVEDRRRDQLPVVGEDRQVGSEREDLGDRRWRTKPCRHEDRDGAVCSRGERRGGEHLPTPHRPGGRGDHAHELDRWVRGEGRQDGHGERAAAQEDRPGSLAGRPVAHASALVAPRTSASSSSSPWPTAISSSIESR